MERWQLRWSCDNLAHENERRDAGKHRGKGRGGLALTTAGDREEDIRNLCLNRSNWLIRHQFKEEEVAEMGDNEGRDLNVYCLDRYAQSCSMNEAVGTEGTLNHSTLGQPNPKKSKTIPVLRALEARQAARLQGVGKHLELAMLDLN